jgi:NMD protein affecting ribosome stability and mRNA decay
MKLKRDDLVWINHNTFNRFETFKVIEINNESIKIKHIETHQTIDITNKAENPDEAKKKLDRHPDTILSVTCLGIAGQKIEL